MSFTCFNVASRKFKITYVTLYFLDSAGLDDTNHGPGTIYGLLYTKKRSKLQILNLLLFKKISRSIVVTASCLVSLLSLSLPSSTSRIPSYLLKMQIGLRKARLSGTLCSKLSSIKCKPLTAWSLLSPAPWDTVTPRPP